MKKIMSFVLAVAMCFSCVGALSGCSSSTESEEDTVEAEAAVSVVEEEAASAKNYDGLDDVKASMTADIDATVSSLNADLDALLTEIDSYNAYKENLDRVESYYSEIVSETYDLCVSIREYAIIYAETILSSDESTDEMRNGMDIIYDDIYEDALDAVYDDIYDELVGDKMYDAFYDGIIADARDSLEYDEYSDARSDEYDRRSDCRSSVYDIRSECRSDIYEFRSDIRSELYADDVGAAYTIVEEFQEYVSGLSGGTINIEENSSSKEESDSESNAAVSDVETDDSADSYEEELVDGMRPSFKQAMDDYEAFYDEYCEFMEMYNADSSDIALIAQYATLLAQMAEMNASFEEWEDEDLNDAELQYYIEVNGRVAQKLLEVAE